MIIAIAIVVAAAGAFAATVQKRAEAKLIPAPVTSRWVT